MGENGLMEFLVDYFSSLITPIGMIGVAALIVALTSFQMNEPKKMVICQLISSTLFTIHFYRLEAEVGAAINIMSAVRSLIYAQTDKKWAMHPVWTYVFVAVSILIAVFLWEGWVSILPVLGAVCYTISFRMKTSKMVRLVSLPSSPCWIVYNAINGSIPGIITECYVIISILEGMLRHDRKKNNNAQETVSQK